MEQQIEKTESSENQTEPLVTVKQFFEYIADRQVIWYKKEVLKEQGPWTDDPILTERKFCNNFRILDRGTKYIVDLVCKNEALSNEEKVFNIFFYRIFNQYMIFEDLFQKTPPTIVPKHFNFHSIIELMDKRREEGVQLFNSAYIIVGTPVGNRELNLPGTDYRPKDKHVQLTKSMCHVKSELKELTENLRNADPEEALRLCRTFPNIGEFLAYQIVLDLTYVKDFFRKGFTDDDFVVIGPGAYTGLSLIFGLPPKISHKPEFVQKLTDMIDVLREKQKDFLPELVKQRGYDWHKISTQESVIYPWLSRNDIEFSLCEARKYFNIKRGAGRGKFYKTGERE